MALFPVVFDDEPVRILHLQTSPAGNGDGASAEMEMAPLSRPSASKTGVIRHASIVC